MNYYNIILNSFIAQLTAVSPLTGDVNLFWIIPAGAICLILVVLLVIFGKKRTKDEDDDE